jgi:hypothetical protein
LFSWANLLLKALYAGKRTSECTFIESPVMAKHGLSRFATQVDFAPNGVEKVHEFSNITAWEKDLLD